MKEKIVARYTYNDLGFPIVLKNVPMKQVFGEWTLNIDLNKLQKDALHVLVHKSVPLTGKELRFIRKYFEMTVTVFGRLLGVTHAAVLKWENDQARLSPATEKYIRLYVLDCLHAKDGEFRSLFKEISIENLADQRKNKTVNLPIEMYAKSKSIGHSPGMTI